MPPKKTKKKDEPETEPEPEPEPELEPSPDDPYKLLRFVPSPYKPPSRRKLKTTKIPVLKPKLGYTETRSQSVAMKESLPVSGYSDQSKTHKRLSIGFSQLNFGSPFTALKEKGVQNYFQLDPMAGVHQKLTTWVSDRETGLWQRPKLALLPRPPSGGNLRLLRLESQRKESHSLARFEQLKKQQLEMENYLMRKVNKQRGSLLLRRDQLMPNIEPGSHEKSVTWAERCDTPPPEKPPILSIFAHGRKENHSRGLVATMSRRDRGHNVITEWLGTPHVTDVIMRELGLAPVDEPSVKRREEEQLLYEPNKSQNEAGQFVPLFPALAVIGLARRDSIEKSNYKTTPAVRAAHGYRAADHTSLQRHHAKAEYQAALEADTTGPLLEVKRHRQTGVVLYFGDHRLSWCPANTAENKRSCTIEVGSTAEYGHSAVSFTTMRNAGTVVIRYNWVRCDKDDPLQHGRHTKLRFAFDSSGGVILPGETHRLPCLFKANDHGYFSEDWRLVSRPVLERGEPIILRLWGVTRQRKASGRDCDQIEKQLRALITRSLVEHTVNKIIDHLPLKEDPYKDTRFPLTHLGPDLFHIKNPSLHYNSASVYRLKKMAEIFDSINQMSFESGNEVSSSFSSNMALSVSASEPDGSVTNVSDDDYRAIARLSSQGELMAKASKRLTVDFDQYTVTYSDTYGEDMQDFDLISLHSGDDPNISHDRSWYLIKKFQRMTDLDHAPLPILKQSQSPSHSSVTSRSPRGSVEALSEKIEANQKKSKSDLNLKPRLGYVNIVDANISVQSLRRQILQTRRLDVQEAAFHILQEEVTKLSFRPQVPMENWKQTVGFTCLCRVLDSFSQYAENLRIACCNSQLQEEIAKQREQEELMRVRVNSAYSALDSDQASKLVDLEEKTEDKNENNLEEHRSNLGERKTSLPVLNTVEGPGEQGLVSGLVSSESVHNGTGSSFNGDPVETFIDHCRKSSPKEVFTQERYEDLYYPGLYSRMYELVGEFIDTIDWLWTTKSELKMNQAELGFTKITNVQRCAKIEDYLMTPMPPPWIQLAQRMDAVVANNRWRIKVAAGEGHQDGSHDKPGFGQSRRA